MFVVNNQILSKQELPETWEWYNKKINELKNSGRSNYIFSGFKFQRFETDETGKKVRMFRFKSIPSFSTFENKELGETQTWIYVPSANNIRNENGILRILNQRPFQIGKNETFSIHKDIEIIFFLTYISQATHSKIIWLVDEEADSIKKANDSAIAAEAQYLIFSPQSPINEEQLGTDEVYRQLAISYGVSGVSNLHIAELKNKLWNNLVNLNKTKRNSKLSYDQFIKDCYNSTDNEMRSSVLLAIERGVVYFARGAWWVKIRGEYDEIIVRVSSNEDKIKKDILINYLNQHRDYLTIITEALDNTTKRLITEIPDDLEDHVNDPDKMKRSQMMSVLIKAGFDNKEVFKWKTSEMREKIKDIPIIAKKD